MRATHSSKVQISEQVLDESFPVYYDYLYVADGKIVRSDFGDGSTVARLRDDLRKRGLSADAITTCDIFGRKEHQIEQDIIKTRDPLC